jgi:hypothetical protein
MFCEPHKRVFVSGVTQIANSGSVTGSMFTLLWTNLDNCAITSLRAAMGRLRVMVWMFLSLSYATASS